MTGGAMRLLFLALVSACVLALMPSVAAAQQTYMECDNAHSPDYPRVTSHPATCNLGLGASYYDVKSVSGRSFGTIGLRRLQWRNWGRYGATAHGLACNIDGDGAANWNQCASVTVHVYRPVAILPAGGRLIYQRTSASHMRVDQWHQFTYWYKPGLDYGG
jgi:hypothetical protein